MRNYQGATWWAILRHHFRYKCGRCRKAAPLKPSHHWLVHHKDGNHDNNKIGNLELFCRSCDAIVHKNDLNHPRRSDIFITCPLCGRDGSLFKWGRALAIYHGKHKKGKDYDYCYLSKYTHRRIYELYFPSLLTDRKAQTYPLILHERSLKLKQKGRTYDEIAEELGIGRTTIVTWLRGK